MPCHDTSEALGVGEGYELLFHTRAVYVDDALRRSLLLHLALGPIGQDHIK